MKAPEPNFTSSTSASVPSAIFFDMMLEADQRDRLDGSGDIAQRVLFLSAGASPEPAAQITAPTSPCICANISSFESAARRPGDRLELVERSAGVAQTAPRQLGDGDPEGCHQRSQRQRDLVAHTAGGVLVDGTCRPAKLVAPRRSSPR